MFVTGQIGELETSYEAAVAAEAVKAAERTQPGQDSNKGLEKPAEPSQSIYCKKIESYGELHFIPWILCTGICSFWKIFAKMLGKFAENICTNINGCYNHYITIEIFGTRKIPVYSSWLVKPFISLSISICLP